jgi:capsular exopolysaccharide synthesis family protein
MNEPMTSLVPQFSSSRMPNEADSAPPLRFRFHKFWLLLVQHWWVPAGTLFLSLIVAGALVMHQPATYLSTGSMWETMKLQFPEGALFNENTENSAGTQNDLLRSTLIQNRALTKLQAASNNVPIPLDSHGRPLPVTVRMLQSTKSAVFTLEAVGPQPAYTQAYLNALMQAYLEYKVETRKQISGDTLASIDEQLKLAEQELKKQQGYLTEFEQTKNLAILQQEGTVAGTYLTTLKTQLSDLESNERLLEAALANLGGNDPGPDQTNQVTLELEALASLPGPQAATVATDLQNESRQLDLLKMQFAELSVNLREQHPKMQQLNKDIEQASNELEVYRRQSRDQLSAATEAARNKVASLKFSVKDWEARVLDVNGRIAEAQRLNDNVQMAQGEYDRLSALMQNFKIGRDLDQETLAILEPASSALRSYSKTKTTLGSSLMGGLLLGFGCIALLTVRDEKFSSILEVKERLGDNVIAQVPEWSRVDGKHQLMTNGELSHPYAESYRSLRSALWLSTDMAKRPRMMLITSALPHEGKSTVAANLAHTLALGGSRVLLVDADLTRGTLHELMHLQQEPGLSQLLSHPADTDKIVQTNSIPNLSFISCGFWVANPGELLLGAALDELLAYWRSQFDYVIIDSCPILAADYTTTLAAKMDGTLFVVRSRFSTERQVRSALEILQNRRSRILGVVFNRADVRSHDYYNYSKYYDEAGGSAS